MEGLKIYLLELCLGPVTPRNPSYKPTPPLSYFNNAYSPRRPVTPQPSLRVDTSRSGTTSWNNMSSMGFTVPTSPTTYMNMGLGSPSSFPAGGSGRRHQHPQTYGSSRYPSSSTTASGPGGGAVSGSDDSDSDYARSPIFATRPDYDYTSDVEWDGDELESPTRSTLSGPTMGFDMDGGAAGATEAEREQVAKARGILSASGIRKATSRVTFKSQKNSKRCLRFSGHVRVHFPNPILVTIQRYPTRRIPNPHCRGDTGRN